MIVRTKPYGAFSGDAWEDWCDSKYAGSPDLVLKCKGKPFGPFTLAPWTDVGAIQRGIPKPGSLLVSMVQGNAAGGGEQAPAAPATIFGLPRTLVYVGGGLLGVGAVALTVRKLRRGRR